MTKKIIIILTLLIMRADISKSQTSISAKIGASHNIGYITPQISMDVEGKHAWLYYDFQAGLKRKIETGNGWNISGKLGGRHKLNNYYLLAGGYIGKQHTSRWHKTSGGLLLGAGHSKNGIDISVMPTVDLISINKVIGITSTIRFYMPRHIYFGVEHSLLIYKDSFQVRRVGNTLNLNLGGWL